MNITGFREAAGPPELGGVSQLPELRRTCCLPEARTYKSIVLLSLIICLRKGYAFEHLEQFHLHALLRRALRKVRGSNSIWSLDRLPPEQTPDGIPL